jgi:hypothetical protein
MSETVRYRVKVDGGKYGSRLRTAKARARLLTAIRSATGEIRTGAQDKGEVVWSGPIKAATATERLSRFIDRSEHGEVFYLDTGRVFGMRKVEINTYKPGVDVDPGIADFWEWVRHRFPRAESWGIFSCRAIGGTDTYSAHAWLKAIDIHAPAFIMAAIARLAVRYRKRWGLAVIIYNRKIASTSSNFKWVPYGGENPHTDHVHVNVSYPSGVPPCARR